jgi:hypothetical protein
MPLTDEIVTCVSELVSLGDIDELLSLREEKYSKIKTFLDDIVDKEEQENTREAIISIFITNLLQTSKLSNAHWNNILNGVIIILYIFFFTFLECRLF